VDFPVVVVQVIRHLDNPDLMLYDETDIDDPLMVIDPDTRRHGGIALTWCKDFLAEPNPDVGRSGDVCPFAGPGLWQRSIWVTSSPISEPDVGSVCELLEELVRWFPALPPTTDPGRTRRAVMVVFPFLEVRVASIMVEEVQAVMKPKFVPRDLMVGQFYPTCPQIGLHSAAFRPLQAPIPMLAVRHMVPSDLPFLTDTTYIGHYHRLHGHEVPVRLVDVYESAIREASGNVSSAPDSCPFNEGGRVA
jgi:hypothetical protein